MGPRKATQKLEQQGFVAKTQTKASSTQSQPPQLTCSNVKRLYTALEPAKDRRGQASHHARPRLYLQTLFRFFAGRVTCFEPVGTAQNPRRSTPATQTILLRDSKQYLLPLKLAKEPANDKELGSYTNDAI